MKLKSLLFLFSGLILFSCSNPVKYQRVKFQGEAQGSYYVVTYYDSLGRDYQPQIDSLLDVFDQSLSLWREHSIINRVNDEDPDVEVDQIFKTVFKASKEIAEHTDGAFDFTIAPLTAAWGFGAKDTLAMDSTRIDSLMQYVGYHRVQLEGNKVIKEHDNVQFDFNAIAQGYTCDYLGEWLQTKGIKNYVIDVGGEVVAKGEKPDHSPWKVGIQDPTAPDEFKSFRIIELRDQGLVTSGNYRKHHKQSGRLVAHTIDPRTGYSAQDSLLSATILAKDAMTADGYATSCMVMGLDRAISFIEKESDMEGFFIYSTMDGSINTYYTKGMEEALVKQD